MVTLDQAGRGRNGLRILPPAPPLRGLVEFLSVEERTPPGGDASWRVVADDAPHLVWQVHEAAGGLRHRVAVVGARSTFTDVDKSARRMTIAARLRPGALPALFRVSAAELTDRAYPLEDLLERGARGSVRRLLEEPPSAAAVERLLAERVAAGAAPSPRIRAFTELAAAPAPSIDAIARDLGISARTLRLLMREEAGLGAKRFLRIRRLHAALDLALAPNPPGWSWIAAAAGYADQSHLIRDFNALLGEPPGAYLARAVAA